MTENMTSPQGATVTPGQNADAETIDLLIRHLESAKRAFSSSTGGTHSEDDGELMAFPNTICSFIYAQPGTFCPLLYLHFPAAAEAVTENA
jgi:hypothetical protein